MIARGDVAIENAAAPVVLTTGRTTLRRNAAVGVVVSPGVTVEAGARVLIGSPLAVAFGACLGAAATMLLRRVRLERTPA